MRKITHCLNRQLVEMCQKTVQIDALNDKLRSLLKPHLHEYCKAGSFNKGCLIITTTNPALATELRYELPEIRNKLRREAGLYQLSSIQIKIIDASMCESLHPVKHPRRRSLSISARQTIQEAEALCNYPPLKEALAKLAKN